MELKEYQEGVLKRFDHYLDVLAQQKSDAEDIQEFWRSKGKSRPLEDYANKAWEQLVQERRVDEVRLKNGDMVTPPYISRFDGLDRTIPNVCFKVPTGGGKTLLGAAAIERLQTDYLRRQTGFVLWVVPSEAIYRQTWKQLANREHPYRQILERASAGRVKILEKDDMFTRRDVEENLCVMLLMLQSSARKSKATLRMFRDSGRFMSFFPAEDDNPANAELLNSIRNLDCNNLDDFGLAEGVTPDSVSIKHSLGNVLRLVRPVVVIDEGHKAYSENAKSTITGFNPRFILELSATPNANGKLQSNVLANVPGSALKEEQMIKLPINLYNEEKADWKHTLSAAAETLSELSKDAQKFQNDSGRYIRPIMVIRVERTGKGQQDKDFVHADDAKNYLIKQLGVRENEIRLKTSETDEIGDEDLLAETCPVKYIITKDALKEGWDCPFAYILTVLSKMTANTALTQMIGRVLRQPHALRTNVQSLDECYVYTYDQDVSDAVQGVKKGLEDEGFGDIANQINTDKQQKPGTKRRVETLKAREKYQSEFPAYVPQVLHKDDSEDTGYRLFSYDQDILGELDWESFSFAENAKLLNLDVDRIERSHSVIDYKADKKRHEQFEFSHLGSEEVLVTEEQQIDLAFMSRQLTEVVPNPWQALRIIEETLSVLRDEQGLSERQIYICRMELLLAMKNALEKDVKAAAEQLFKQKLAKGDIKVTLVSPRESDLNWQIPSELPVSIGDSGQILRRKDGSELERSLYEKVYKDGFNKLELDAAWELDREQSVHWWHRVAVSSAEYSVQGWQKQRVYPDLIVCIKSQSDGIKRYALLETKGEHLKGNDDTEYKKRLFDILTEHVKESVTNGEIDLGSDIGKINFTILMEDSMPQELREALK